MTPFADEKRKEFDVCVLRWRAETEFCSSIESIVAHSDYQRVIRMGKGVLPLIFQELERQTDFWFSALREITRVNPIPHEYQGKVLLMADTWLEWGKENGFMVTPEQGG